jgi:hypothetical protein
MYTIRRGLSFVADRHLSLKSYVTLLLTVFALATAANAATYTVTTTADSGRGSLRAAIGSAASGDTINITAKGTITLASTLTLSKNVTITGPGASVLTVSGGGVVIVFTIKTRITVSISGLTIANGYSNYMGGGIYNVGKLTVSNSTLSSNSASNGGGIFNQGTLTVSNSTLSGNSASNDGGGIYNNGGTLTVSNSTFSGNSASTYSGGIGNPIGTVTVSNSTFSGNSASDGGGIVSGGTLTVSNSTFFGNTTKYGGGGGIYNYDTLTVSNSTFSGNTASLGGGIYNFGATVTVSNSIVAGNTTAGAAGDDCANCGTQSASNLISTTASPITAAQLMLGPLALNGTNQTVQTLLPLPGSPAIEAGNPALLPTGLTTDQRGLPRTVGRLLDLGAVQTNYTAVQFVQQPTSTLINATMKPAVTLSVIESGAAAINIPVPITLSGSGTLGGTLTETTTAPKGGGAAIATYGDMSVNAKGTGDTLNVSLPITPAGAATPLTLTATSSSFDITTSHPPPPSPSLQAAARRRPSH